MVPEIISGIAKAALGEGLEAGEDRGLRVQGVEDGLDEENVRAAVDEASDLLAIGDAEFVEADRAEAGIVDVRREGRRSIRRTQRASDEAAASVRLFRLDRRPPRQSRPVAIEFVDLILHSVVGLRDRGRREGVGLENVRARERVGQMDVLDRLRLGQGQEIIVALQRPVAGMKAFAAKVGFTETEALDLGAHGAVDEQDALTAPRFGAPSARPRGALGSCRRRRWETNSFHVPLNSLAD